jgi:HEAT repeat protein
MKPFLLLLISQALFGQALLGQAPRVANARIESRNGANLEATFRAITAAQESPAWVGYTVPATPGDHNSCCWSDGYRGCALEGQNRVSGAATGPVMLEGSSTLVVLFRVANHAVEKTRSVSGDCELDAGGLPFLLLTGVRPAESVALLEAMVTEKDTHAIAIIAMHGDPAADQALERLASSSRPEKIREKTLFWLGSSPRKSGYETLKRIAQQDPSDAIRDKAMFALSVSKEPDAVDTMIESAKNDKSPRVRGQALFWLAHKAGQKETAAITSAVQNDPDLAVKKKALFALSQLPKDEGVPKLIEIARTNKTPEVRKQAMFWLGQSKDPRALSFFQEILSK